MVSVALVKLAKRFGDVVAVDDIDLQILDGEFVALVGPSGCGKSTTLRMIAGLEEPSEGSIHFGDRDVTYLTSRERNIAMVFQSYALYPHMDVFENIAFTLRQRNTPRGKIAELVGQAADMLGISNLLERFPKELSGGQRQRVAMGRAVVRQPTVFLFDEPLSNLDAALRTQMRVEIKKLHQKLKTTVIYVTHDQIEAMTLADKIVVMNNGEVMQVGSPMDLYRRPKSKFVAGFLGSPKMNFIPCQVRATDQGLEFYIDAQNRFLVPPQLEAVCARYVGKDTEIGIRPEDILIGHEADKKRWPRITGNVEVLEPTGADTFVVLSVGGTDVQVRCPPEEKFGKVGDRIAFNLNADRMLLIDTQSERVLYD
ncbi:MAG: ABC transporter ATP-binding protein [Burkholderiaceae bacterium]|nr:ABC transporter ATP-binding protein [Burkholderiaceae bacterium]